MSLVHFLICRWLVGVSFCPSRISIKSAKQHSMQHTVLRYDVESTNWCWLLLWTWYSCTGLKLHFHFLFLFGLFIKISVSVVPSLLSLCGSFYFLWGPLFPQYLPHFSLPMANLPFAIPCSTRRDDCPLFINAICIGASMPTTCTSSDWFAILFFRLTFISLAFTFAVQS